MQKNNTETFGGTSFSTSPIPARRALRLAAMLQAGGVDATGKGLNAMSDPDKIVSLVLEALCSTQASITGSDANGIAKAMILGFGGPQGGDNLDVVFSGQFTTMFQVVEWVLNLNFKPGDSVSPAVPALQSE